VLGKATGIAKEHSISNNVMYVQPSWQQEMIEVAVVTARTL